MTSPQTTPSRTVPINGVDYYVEIHGQGAPLLLLHGGVGSIAMFGPVLGLLAEQRQVIAVDLYGHGHTALTERAIDPVTIGDDMAGLVAALGHERVDVLGFSFGAYVGFQMAAQHPDRVGKLILASMPLANDGFYPEVLEQQKFLGRDAAPMMMQTPLYTEYAAVAPRPGDFPEFIERMGQAVRKPFDWSDQVGRLTGHVMLVYADADMIRYEAMIDFYHRLGGGLRDAGWNREAMAANRLAILPNQTHYDVSSSPKLAAVALDFLDGR